MDDRIAVHVVDRTENLEDNAVDACLRKRFSLALRFQVASRKQLQDEIDSFLIVKEPVQRSGVKMREKALDLDLSH